MIQIFHICERDKKRSLPSTPFLRAWLVAELDAKNRAIRDPAVRPQFPARQGITCRFQNRDFSDFCQFRSSENRVSEVFQARKTAKRQKNGNLRLAHHTPAASTPAGSGEHGGTARLGGGGRRGATRGRVRTHHAPRFQALTLFAEYPVQAGVRCGGEAACGAAARRIDSGAHQDWHVCVQVGMRCVRHGPCGMVC